MSRAADAWSDNEGHFFDSWIEKVESLRCTAAAAGMRLDEMMGLWSTDYGVVKKFVEFIVRELVEETQISKVYILRELKWELEGI